MRVLALLLFSGLIAGCANSTRYTEAALSWESAPTHLLIAALGNPTYFYPAEDRGDILFWHFKKDPGLTSYVKSATQKLLSKDDCSKSQMSFSRKTLCRPAVKYGPEEKPGYSQQTTPLLAEASAYDCQIVATLSEDGLTVSKIDVLAEGNCDMLEFDSYNRLGSL